MSTYKIEGECWESDNFIVKTSEKWNGIINLTLPIFILVCLPWPALILCYTSVYLLPFYLFFLVYIVKLLGYLASAHSNFNRLWASARALSHISTFPLSHSHHFNSTLQTHTNSILFLVLPSLVFSSVFVLLCVYSLLCSISVSVFDHKFDHSNKWDFNSYTNFVSK